jgi:hypothetical protein
MTAFLAGMVLMVIAGRVLGSRHTKRYTGTPGYRGHYFSHYCETHDRRWDESADGTCPKCRQVK